MISYVKLKDLTLDASFTSSTTKEAFRGKITHSALTQRAPAADAVSGGWVGVGRPRSSGKLVLEFPGSIPLSSLKKWRWFTVETQGPNSKKYTTNDTFVRVTAEEKHLEMFSLLAYFLLSRMAAMYKDGDTPAALAEKALGEWEQYLGVRAENPSILYTGAFGEIYVLNRLICEIGPGIVRGWAGPCGGSQDILIDVENKFTAGIEVKTVGVDTDSLRINGVAQLASPGLLLAVRLGQNESSLYTGSLGDLISQVEAALAERPEELQDFKKKLEYLPLDESSEHYKSERHIVKVEYWDMNDLPRVRVSDPGKEKLWSVIAMLSPGPGTPLDSAENIKPILEKCSAPTDGGEAL